MARIILGKDDILVEKERQYSFYKMTPYGKKGKERLLIYGKKGIVANLEWSDKPGVNEANAKRALKEKKVMPEGVKPEVVEVKYYRSTLTNIATVGANAETEYRVWIYTNKSGVVSSSELWAAMNKLFDIYPSQGNFDNYEKEEPIDEDEVDGDLNTFYGFAEFVKKNTKKIYHYPRTSEQSITVEGNRVIILGEI